MFRANIHFFVRNMLSLISALMKVFFVRVNVLLTTYIIVYLSGC